MKVFPSYAANPEKRQLSFRSPKSAILSSATCTYDDHFHFRKPIARVDGEAAYFSHALFTDKSEMEVSV